MSTIQEISEEMENSIPAIASGALDFIHAGECVLVLGQSSTIQHFLALAAKKIKFQVKWNFTFVSHRILGDNCGRRPGNDWTSYGHLFIKFK